MLSCTVHTTTETETVTAPAASSTVVPLYLRFLLSMVSIPEVNRIRDIKRKIPERNTS